MTQQRAHWIENQLGGELMQNKSGPSTVVGILVMYLCTIATLAQLHPASPVVAGVRVGLIVLFSSACAYAFVLWKRGGFAGLVACSPTETFSSLPKTIIQSSTAFVCGLILTYPIMSAVPLITDHHSMQGWRDVVKFQTGVIEKVEGKLAAEKYWRQCFFHILDKAANFEHRGNLIKALDYYCECKDLQDESEFSSIDLGDVIGLICDRLNEFDAADIHYFNTGDIMDEYSTGLHSISSARLLRILKLVPEDVVVANFTWGKDIVSLKNEESFVVAQHYNIIDMSKLDDYKRELIRPVFHREILPGKSKLTAPQLVSLGESWKHPYQRLTDEQYLQSKFYGRFVLRSIGVNED